MWKRALPLLLISLVAVGRVVAASPLPVAPRADDALKRTMYEDLRSHEREMREKAAQDFPTDPWSHDDAFHAFESDRVHDLARAQHVPVTDVLLALDDGMRSAHARGEKTMTPFVPPCHPRAIY